MLDRVPEFWEWLLHMGAANRVKIPLEIVEEIVSGTDDLAEWLSDREHRDALQLDEEIDVSALQKIIAQGYAPDLTDDDIEKIGRDPFLIAYAMIDTTNRCVVTAEVSKPSATRSNRRVPDVCRSMNITWMNGSELVRKLNFSTSWRVRL